VPSASVDTSCLFYVPRYIAAKPGSESTSRKNTFNTGATSARPSIRPSTGTRICAASTRSPGGRETESGQWPERRRPRQQQPGNGDFSQEQVGDGQALGYYRIEAGRPVDRRYDQHNGSRQALIVAEQRA
jgi:hypothetical protein